MRDISTTHRRSIRLRGYDYAQVGAYFITVVTVRRSCLFGKIIDDEMHLNAAGSIVQSAWRQLPEHFTGIETDAFVVMPNHVHGIIHINGVVGAQHAAPSIPHVQPGSLGAIVRSFKSAASKHYNEQYAESGAAIWQRNYYDHVIRDEKTLIRIREYITTNPARWSTDPENPLAARPERRDLWRANEMPANGRAQHAAPLQSIRKI